MRRLLLWLACSLLTTPSSYAIFDVGPLLQLVAGQIQEIERLTEAVGIAKDQTKFLLELNEGINRTVQQIQAIQAIVDRAQGVDPSQVKSLADLNDLLSRAKDTRQQLEELLGLKVAVADQAIAQGALQSDTSYKMGQEMVSVGAQLATESQTASPGRAAQISAAAGSAQMLSQGVELQTLAHMVQLQAMSLEFLKSQVQKELVAENMRREVFRRQLGAKNRRVRP